MRSFWVVLGSGALALACGGVTRSSHEGPSTDGGAGGSTANSSAGQSYTTSCRPDCGPQGGGVSGAGAADFGGVSSAGQAAGTLPSSGCGKDLPAGQLPTVPSSRSGYTEFFVNETGATLGIDLPKHAGARQFFVRVPFGYDKQKPYRVVYLYQGCGGQRMGNTNTYALFDETRGGSEEAVYVAISVPDNDVNPGCNDNNSGVESQEWEAFDLIHTFVEASYCVDNDRIFVAGFSSGGWVSNMLGCYFGGTPTPPLDTADVQAERAERKFLPRWAVRGRGLVSGNLPLNQPVPCNGPGAGLWIHDVLDRSNVIEGDYRALELALKTNQCTGDRDTARKEPWAPAEDIPGLAGGVCQHYTSCPPEIDARYPLVFCTTQNGGHTDHAFDFLPAFTAFAAEMDPKP